MSVHMQTKWYQCKYCDEKFIHTMQLVRQYPKCDKNPENANQ